MGDEPVLGYGLRPDERVLGTRPTEADERDEPVLLAVDEPVLGEPPERQLGEVPADPGSGARTSGPSRP